VCVYARAYSSAPLVEHYSVRVIRLMSSVASWRRGLTQSIFYLSIAVSISIYISMSMYVYLSIGLTRSRLVRVTGEGVFARPDEHVYIYKHRYR